jgi:hypothetical protein
VIQLDASFGEGGGQILRSALALSVVKGRAIRLTNIRANRAQPGLKAQHLAAVLAAAQISEARVEGAGIGSQSLKFEPRTLKAGAFRHWHRRFGLLVAADHPPAAEPCRREFARHPDRWDPCSLEPLLRISLAGLAAAATQPRPSRGD